MIFIVLYNCGLELLNTLPRKVLSHPAIKNDCKRRKKNADSILLDLAIHQSAIPENIRKNRGRPDIVHQSVLQFLYSRALDKEIPEKGAGSINLIIHSINNSYFEVPKTWNPPTHYLRFRGLIENLLSKGRLKVSETESIKLKQGEFSTILKKFNFSEIFLFTSHSEVTEIPEFRSQILKNFTSEEKVLYVIGRHQHGNTPHDIIASLELAVKNASITKIALPGGRLPSWKIVGDIVNNLE